MAKKDLTVEILIQIREEMKATREQLSGKIDATNTRLDSLSQRVDSTNDRLQRVERAQTESEVRLATEIVAVVSAINQLKDLIVADRELRNRVDEHDRRLSALEHHAP
jgi:chromosome segregation ATPase